MLTFLNGEFVSEEAAHIPISDRGFLYGDGFFETLRIHNGQPFRWASHAARMERAHQALRIPTAIDSSTFSKVLCELARRNAQAEGIARLYVTRGSGSRGYSPRDARSPTVLVTMHPLPEPTPTPQLQQWTLITAQSVRLPPPNPLSSFKHANLLVQILARIEADDQGANDAVVLDHSGSVAESSSANIFWVLDGVVHTPPLETNALPGVTRSLVIELCARTNLDLSETRICPEDLNRADSVFLSLSSFGIVAVSRIGAAPIPCSALVHRLHEAYLRQLESECPAGDTP